MRSAFLKFDTIGKRLMFPTIAILVILLGSLGASLIINQYALTRAMIESKASTVAGLLQKIGAPFIASYDYIPLEIFVQEAVKNPEIAFVVYCDAQGKAITSSSKEPADTSSLFVYRHTIQDSEGKTTGFLKAGYSKQALSAVLRGGVYRVAISIVIAILLMTGALMIVIRIIVRSLRSISEGLHEGAQQVSSASQQISLSSRNVATGASHQAAGLEEISSSMEEMTSTTKGNWDHATHSRKMTEDAAQIVEKVNQHMTQMEEAMAEVRRSSEATGEIVKTIDEIAFQTNLLSLNAAVEAARAGNAGAGFGVVAGEVRNLAMRASGAAKNTSELIEATIKAVKNGADLVNVTRNAFKANIEISARMKTLVEEISTASEEQAQGIEQINSNINGVTSTVQANADSAKESASAAEELTVEAAKLQNYAEQLASLISKNSSSKTLKHSVSPIVERGKKGFSDSTA
jgi:hypothetical protein